MIKKTFAILAVLAIVFSFAAPGAYAQYDGTGTGTTTNQNQTVSGLQAQINSLLALIAQLQARLAQGGTVGTPSGFMFTSNLTIGSGGNEVTQLQQFLVSRGFLTMPAGTAFGYFGPLTRTALASFQASQGITPAVGFFGPITRARVNTMLTPTTPPGGGTGTTTPGGGMTTPGVEGTMTVTSSNAGLRSTVYEGETQVPVLGMRIQARTSDIAVQRVTVDLGTSSRLYNRILERLYVTDGTNVLASADLNSSTVIRDGNRYSVTITGFNYIVPRNSDRNLVIKADLQTSIDSEDRTSFTLQLANNGVRGIDGAGIDHYSPSTGSSISRNINVSESLAESATLRLSLNTNTPRQQEVVANEGVDDDELDRLTILAFDLRSERDDVVIRDMQVNITKSGSGTATSSTVYLYDGSTEIDNASIASNGTATFQDIDYSVPRGSTRTLTVRVDIRNANETVANFVASIPSSGIVAENTLGDQLNTGDISGSASGYQIGVRNVGSEFALASKSITTSGVPQANDETSILTATFNVRVRAVGSDLILGTPASTTPAFDTDSFAVYRNGVEDTSINPTAISYSTPSGTNTAGLTDSFRIPEGTEVTIPVTVQLRGRDGGTAVTSGLYAIGFEEVTWIADNTLQTVNFMAGDTDWRTTDVSFP